MKMFKFKYNISTKTNNDVISLLVKTKERYSKIKFNFFDSNRSWSARIDAFFSIIVMVIKVPNELNTQLN